MKTLKEIKNQNIINAAIYEFKKNGYIATNMDMICKRAEVSKRTIYKHFENKDELFNEVLKKGRQKIGSVKYLEYQENIDIKKQFFNLGYNISKVLMNREFIEISRIVFSRYLHFPETTRNVLTDEDIFITQVESFIINTTKKGGLNVQESHDAAIEFIGLIRAFGFFPQIFGFQPILKESEINKVVSKCVDMFLLKYVIDKK